VKAHKLKSRKSNISTGHNVSAGVIVYINKLNSMIRQTCNNKTKNVVKSELKINMK